MYNSCDERQATTSVWDLERVGTGVPVGRKGERKPVHTIAGQDERCTPGGIRLGRGRRRVRPDLAGSHTELIFHGQALQAARVVGRRYSCSRPPVPFQILCADCRAQLLKRPSSIGFEPRVQGRSEGEAEIAGAARWRGVGLVDSRNIESIPIAVDTGESSALSSPLSQRGKTDEISRDELRSRRVLSWRVEMIRHPIHSRDSAFLLPTTILRE